MYFSCLLLLVSFGSAALRRLCFLVVRQQVSDRWTTELRDTSARLLAEKQSERTFKEDGPSREAASAVLR